jgi:histidinol dehydrogenase
VRKDGDAALAHFAKTFDDFEGPVRVGEDEFEAAKKELPAEIIEGLDFAIERVTTAWCRWIPVRLMCRPEDIPA